MKYFINLFEGINGVKNEPYSKIIDYLDFFKSLFQKINYVNIITVKLK